MYAYIETLYTENNLSVGSICLMTGYTRAEVMRALRAMDLVE